MSDFALTTSRLHLRQLTLNDAPFTLELVNEAKYIENIRDQGVRTLSDARYYLQNGPMHSYSANGFGMYAVCLKASNEPIGICGLLTRPNLPSPDIGYAFLTAYHGRGYASEACSAVLKDAKKRLKLKEVVAVTSPDNLGSRRVLQKAGFEEKGHIVFYDKPNVYYVKQL